MNHKIPSWIPMGWALRHSLSKGYQFSDLSADLKAAFVVSLIALPLSMALAIAIGLPPQHGITTAIVAGIIASFFGGSAFQISGPTAAFVVILIPIVSNMGLHGLIWCQLLAGIFLVLFGILKFGKFIEHVPYAVTLGFTSAIAIVIASISLKDFFAIPMDDATHHFADKMMIIFHNLPQLQIPNTLVGITALVLLIATKDKIKWLPSPIIGVMGAALLAYVFNRNGYPIMTIGSEFHSFVEGKEIDGIPPFVPSFALPTLESGQLLSIPTWSELTLLIVPALTISALAALESLLSATIADNLTKTKHQPNAELKGIGFANIFSAMASGIPATAAIARTATNIQNGARSPISGIFHSVLVLGYVLVFAPFINLIPMSALAALLLVTAYRMSHAKQFWQLLNSKFSFNHIVLLSTFGFTLFADMILGIGVGMFLVMLQYSLNQIKRWVQN